MAFSQVSRRDFLKASAAGAVATSVVAGATPSLHAAPKGGRAKSCIFLWLGGGPSQKETFDPKPESKFPGEYKPIETSVPGMRMTELFPKLARHMQHAAILRAVAGAGDHVRGTYFAHTGVPIGSGGLVYPTLGSIVSAELDKPGFEMPKCVMMGNLRQGASPGFLGAAHAPLQLPSLAKVEDLFTQQIDRRQLAREMSLFDAMEAEFYQSRTLPAVDAHRKTVHAAARFMHARDLRAFDLSQERPAVREAYGSSGDGKKTLDFSQACLIARRLVEVGVPFIEIYAGEWDHHNNIAQRIGEVGRPLDTALSALIDDLHQRGLLESTLIAMFGEMGRAPTIPPAGANYGLGRHHWPHVMSAMLIGGGIQGGQVIGRSDQEAGYPEDRPVSVLELQATIFTALGIDHIRDHQVEPGGRPIPILKPGTEPVHEVLA